MSDDPCPCSGGGFPRIVFNAPAQPALSYRWGDYDGFRNALLQPAQPPLPAETQLSKVDGTLVWRPAPDVGDLALQIAEWWAYLADILTLYAERTANQAYLRTADLPESLPRLVPILGYRPRPAIGAQLTLAAQVRGPRPVLLPSGLQVQSKPGPGQQPQVFELAGATTIAPIAPIATVPPTTPMPAPLPSGGTSPTPAAPLATQVVLSGKPSGVKVGDEVLLIGTGWAGQSGDWALGTIAGLTPTGKNTTVALSLTASGGGTGPAGAANWRLLKAASSSPLYPYLTPPLVPWGAAAVLNNVGQWYAELASVVRSLAPGDIILVENPTPGNATAPTLGYVTGVKEWISYANNPSDPLVWPPAGSPPNQPDPAVPIPHTVVLFYTQGALQGDPGTLLLRYGYSDVGPLIDAPVTGSTQTASVTLDPAGLAASGLAAGSPMLVADANGDGGTATLGTGGVVTVDASAPALLPPILAQGNLLLFTHGKTVTQEVLGSGNAAVAGQDFTLRNTPVTYLADQPGVSGPGYSSTVTLWVNGVQWREVPNFFGQAANAQVFTTYEDTSGNTHILGGDGSAGARFPTGNGNLIASYRVGSGAALPPPTSVTVLMQPRPGLSAVVNPVPPYGGADADSPADLRSRAPQTVVTFGRAVSVDDYAAIAAATPGVARVSAAYAFNAAQQRPVVTLWVGDDANAVTVARQAITPVSDPNRPVAINVASPVLITIMLTYVRDPRFQDAAVRAAVQAALADPAAGLFGADVVQIGQAFYDSQIYARCLAVPGVQSVHDLAVTIGPPRRRFYVWQIISVWAGGRRLQPAASTGCTGHRHDPGPDGYFVLASGSPVLTGALGS
jgi:Baseplate J-like protein